MEIPQMVYSYVFTTAVLHLPKVQREPQSPDSDATVIDDIAPPSAIVRVSKRMYVEA